MGSAVCPSSTQEFPIFKKHLRLAITALIALGLVTTTASCAPSNIADDGSNLSTSLAPVPLDEPATITLTMSAKLEVFTPALLAIAEGEFEKENVTVDVQILPLPDAIPALAQGLVDVSVTTMSAAVLNAIAGGAELKAVVPGATNRTEDGLYAATALAEVGPSALRGKKIGMAFGVAQLAMLPVLEYLAEGGLTVDDVIIETIPQADLPAALAAGQVDAAWLGAPQHLPLVEENLVAKVAAYDPDIYASVTIFGPNLLTKNPELGQAVVRALTRTSITYLQGDYKRDPVVAQKVADVLEIPLDSLTSTASMTFGFDMENRIVTQAQEFWLSVGDILTYDTILEPSQYIDSSFVDRIVIE